MNQNHNHTTQETDMNQHYEIDTRPLQEPDMAALYRKMKVACDYHDLGRIRALTSLAGRIRALWRAQNMLQIEHYEWTTGLFTEEQAKLYIEIFDERQED